MTTIPDDNKILELEKRVASVILKYKGKFQSVVRACEGLLAMIASIARPTLQPDDEHLSKVFRYSDYDSGELNWMSRESGAFETDSKRRQKQFMRTVPRSQL